MSAMVAPMEKYKTVRFLQCADNSARERRLMSRSAANQPIVLVPITTHDVEQGSPWEQTRASHSSELTKSASRVYFDP